MARLPLFVLLALLPVATRAEAAELTMRVAGSGAVQTSPAGHLVRCVADACIRSFPRGTTVRLLATPSGRGARLVKWQGNCRGRRERCTLTMNGDRVATAAFSPVRLMLDGDVRADPPGAPCGGHCRAYAFGTVVRLAALIRPGWVF